MDVSTESDHDDEEELRQALALSRQESEKDADAQRREEELLQTALEISRQACDGSASPSMVQLRLSETKHAAVAAGVSSTTSPARADQLAPMRSWFSVPIPTGRPGSRLGGELVVRGVGMSAAVAACLAGTWTDWSTKDGTIQPKPKFCITIQPLEGQILFGVHIVLLEEPDERSEQHVVQVVESGIEVVEGEAGWAGLSAELQWIASAPILKWSNGNSWRKSDASVSQLYSKFYVAPPPPPGASPLAGRPQPQRPEQGTAQQRSEFAEERRRFTALAMESRRPPPPGSTIEDVPGTGACLFHAIALTQDEDAARQLRHAVVNFVAENWDANPDISAIMGAERRAIQPTISLQEEFCRQYGDATIRSGDDYRSLMERDGTYGEQSEAAVAAMLLGVELTIYASAAPPGMEPAPQNLYREASGLGLVGGERRMVLLKNRDRAWSSHYMIIQ